MNKFKDFFIRQNLKWRYSNETTPLVARKSFKIGIGLAFITIGIFLIFFFKPAGTANASYQSVDTTPTKALNALKPTDQTKKLTFILYRDDCKACQHVEKKLVGKIQTLRDDKQAKIVITDLKKMDQQQLKTIQAKLPEIMVDQTKIPTPLVANLTIKKDGTIEVTQQSNTDNFTEIENVLNKAGKAN